MHPLWRQGLSNVSELNWDKAKTEAETEIQLVYIIILLTYIMYFTPKYYKDFTFTYI